MKLSTFAIIVTVLAFGSGLALIFIPVKLMGHYGISLTGGGVLFARYFGAANIFLGMIFWSYSGVASTAKSWPKLLRFSLIYGVLQLAITVKAVLNGGTTTMGWATVALFALLAIGSGYFLSQSNKAAA